MAIAWGLPVDPTPPPRAGVVALATEPLGAPARRIRLTVDRGAPLPGGWSRPATAVRVRASAGRYLHFRSSDGSLRFLGLQAPAWAQGEPRRVPLVIQVPPAPSTGAPLCKPQGQGIGAATVDGVPLAQALGVLIACPQATSRVARSGAFVDVRPFANPAFVEDLARLPRIVDLRLRQLGFGYRVDPTRVYLVGGSGGGYPALLAIARHPGLVRGAYVFDTMAQVTWRVTQTSWLDEVPSVRQTLRDEGLLHEDGTPDTAALATRDPSAPAELAAMAASRTRLVLGYSIHDRVVPLGEPRHVGWYAAALVRAGKPVLVCRHRGVHGGQFRASQDSDRETPGPQPGSPDRWADALGLLGLGPAHRLPRSFCPWLAHAAPVR